MKRGWGWPVFLVGLLVAGVGVNLVLLVAATGDPSFAVERDYYRKGMEWDRTLAQVDVVFAVSEHYRKLLAAETRVPVITLGNGVELDHFAPARPAPDDLRDLPRPRIGYFGLLSHFLDFDALEALRRARGGGTLVLVGPGSPATEARVRALAAREGVVVLGPRPYEQAPAYMQAFDLGVIPFRARDPYVQGINPNKVYQYLAAGRPVVTTPLLDLPPTAPVLQFATDPAGFATAIGKAMEFSRDPGACRSLARPFDWSTLAHRMVAEIESRIPPGA